MFSILCIPPSEKKRLLNLPGLADTLKKRRVSADNLEEALQLAWSSSVKCGGPPADVLKSMGYSVEEADLRVCGVIVRGRADIDLQKVFIDKASAEEITAKLMAECSKAGAGANLPGHTLAAGAEVIAAHELFHILEPSAPSYLAEYAANLFASIVLRLPFYAGVI